MTLQDQIEKYRIVDPSFANILEKKARKAELDQQRNMFERLQKAARFANQNPDAFLSGRTSTGQNPMGSFTPDEFFREFNSAQQMFNTVRPGENFMDYLLGRRSNSMANAPKTQAYGQPFPNIF